MLIKTTKTEEIEIDLPLPAYFEYGNTVQCILGERESIEVSYYGWECGVRYVTDSAPATIHMREGKPVTSEYFSSKLAEVKAKINQLT